MRFFFLLLENHLDMLGTERLLTKCLSKITLDYATLLVLILKQTF